GLRVLVEPLHVGVGRRGVEVEVVFLHVLAVVALDAGEAEQPLLQDRIAAVPEQDREADALFAIADPGEAVFVPPERARARLIERKIPPGVAVRAVVLATRAPCPLADVRAPSLPGHAPIHAFLEAPRFRVHRLTRPRSASASGSPAGGARAPIGAACGMAPDE